MAKPNLTSIFTSTNQYSVLKLLKALCDAVDNIDYTDNTEFTKFKEQINSAVASLNSTDDSLQEQIDNNLNSIGDINAQISILERPDANTTVVNKGITVKDNGDVTVGRNLEVDGKTKLMSGLEVIHTYKINELYSLKIYIENSDEGTGGFNFIGCISNPLGECYPCYGNYTLLTGTKLYFHAIVLVDTATGVFNSPEFWTYNAAESTPTLAIKKFAFADAIPDVSTLQPKLYRHVIRLSGGTAPNSYQGYIVYDCSSNLKVDSLQDLTALTKATGGFRYPLSGLCIQGGITGNPTATNYNLLGYDGSIWHVDSYIVTTTSPTITTVSDTVTTL